MQEVLTRQDDARLFVTLNRPEKANALNLTMLSELTEVFEAAALNDALHAVVVQGAGERVFCAGADLSELSTDPNDPSIRLWEDMSEALNRLPILTVALIQGPCIGGGMTLAMGCDIRIGSAGARFSYPALKNGVFPGERDVERLTALIGRGRMSSLLLGGQSVDTETALSWGLLDQVVSASDLASAGHAMTEIACTADRRSIVEMKRFCREG